MTQEMFSNAFLIISMRGRESTNTTIDHLKELASKLEASGNKLMLCGVGEAAVEHMEADEQA
jgi:hypothetical protein